MQRIALVPPNYILSHLNTPGGRPFASCVRDRSRASEQIRNCSCSSDVRVFESSSWICSAEKRRWRRVRQGERQGGGGDWGTFSVLHAAGTAALVHHAQAASASQVALALYLSLQSTAGPANGQANIAWRPANKSVANVLCLCMHAVGEGVCWVSHQGARAGQAGPEAAPVESAVPAARRRSRSGTALQVAWPRKRGEAPSAA